MRDYSTLHSDINSNKGPVSGSNLVRKDIDVNEHERLFNITLRLNK
jgi:hypothetical protein